MKCIIAGGRDFDDYNRLVRVMDECPYEITEVVCGKARGADSLGEKWALSREIKVSYFIPDWESLGKRAGFVRNNDMAEYACKDGVDKVENLCKYVIMTEQEYQDMLERKRIEDKRILQEKIDAGLMIQFGGEWIHKTTYKIIMDNCFKLADN